MAAKTAYSRVICAVAALLSLLIFAALMGGLTAAFAAPAQTCSLTLNCVVTRDGARIVLAGDAYGIAKVADAEIDENGNLTFNTVSAFLSRDKNWASMSEHEFIDAAAELDGFAASSGLYVSTATVDANGQAHFANLSYGIYLVTRISTGDVGKNYDTSPFLVQLPQNVNGMLTFDVTATPKFAWHDLPYNPQTPTPEPETPTSTGGMPQTGSALLFALIAICIVSGIALVVVLRRGKKNGKAETDKADNKQTTVETKVEPAPKTVTANNDNSSLRTESAPRAAGAEIKENSKAKAASNTKTPSAIINSSLHAESMPRAAGAKTDSKSTAETSSTNNTTTLRTKGAPSAESASSSLTANANPPKRGGNKARKKKQQQRNKPKKKTKGKKKKKH